MEVENTGKVDVPHLLFDSHSDHDPVRQGSDIALNRNMLLGCDILLKNFIVTMSKKQGTLPTVTLSLRDDLTPPASPEKPQPIKNALARFGRFVSGNQK